MGQNNSTAKQCQYKHFTEKERYKLEGYREAKLSVKEITTRLNKHAATIYREIKRGRVVKISSELVEYSAYRANVAQKDYQRKVTNRERSLKIGKDKALEEHIRNKLLKARYSPDAIIGQIKAKSLQFEGMICTKTLYNYIDRGIFNGISNANLWEKRKLKKKRYKRIVRISLKNKMAPSIEDRSEAINNRLEYGHWEGDCVKGPRGKSKGSLFTLTERKTREQIIIKIKNGLQSQIQQSINNLERKYGEEFINKFKTITFDNGSEFLDYQLIEQSCLNSQRQRIKVYFAHPFSAWERGSNENQNRLIRRFIPKGTDIAKISNKEVKRIENWMNNYPRKILGYKTANESVLELTGNNKFLS